MSGLVNYHKSEIQDFKGIPNVDKKEIAQILQINSISTIGTYLGCINIDKKKNERGFDDG